MIKLLLLTLVLFFNNAWSQDSFKRLDKLRFDNQETMLRSSSFFAGNENEIGLIEKGTEARITGFDLTKRYGIGVEIEILSGPKKGKKGWVYYPLNPDKRDVTLLDRSGLPFQREGEFFDFFKKAAKYKDEIKQATHIDLIEQAPVAIEYDPKKRDYIWRQISKGEYQINLEKYDGGPFVPVIADEIDENGNKVTKTLFVRRDFNRMINMAKQVAEVNLGQEELFCPPDSMAAEDTLVKIEQPAEEIKVRPIPRPERTIAPSPVIEGKWHPHCQVLAKSPQLESDEAEMVLCLQSLKKSVTENNLNEDRKYIRSQVFRDMYRKLNPTEQRFLALSLTAYGESGILRDERDMKMIMRVIDNRVKYANKKGRSPKANELDIVLQPLQFSMYNANQNDWRQALEASPHDPGIKLAVSSYRKYPNASFEPKEKIDDIRHYHATYVNPNWASRSKLIPVQIDGDRTRIRRLKVRGERVDVRHEFYQNIAWSFAPNTWRP